MRAGVALLDRALVQSGIVLAIQHLSGGSMSDSTRFPGAAPATRQAFFRERSLRLTDGTAALPDSLPYKREWKWIW
jgi:hypothetical protein